MDNNIMEISCFKYLIRKIKTQDELLIFARNYFLLAERIGMSEQDAVIGYVSFRSNLSSANSNLQLTLYKGKTLSADNFRVRVLSDVEIVSTIDCQTYIDAKAPYLTAVSNKRGAGSICSICGVMVGTKKYKNKFKREESVLIRFICESHANFLYLRELLDDIRPSSIFKSQINIVDELDADIPIIIPINMLFVKMIEGVDKDFYGGEKNTDIERLIVERCESRSALFSNSVRKFELEKITELQELTGVAFQDLFKFVYDVFIQNIISIGTPSREYVGEVVNAILRENSGLRKKKKKEKKEEHIPSAPSVSLYDVFDQNEMDVNPIGTPVEVKGADGTTLVYYREGASFDDEVGSDGVDELPFAPVDGEIATKLSEKYADELEDGVDVEEPDEPVIANEQGADAMPFDTDPDKEAEEIEEPEEPDEPVEPSGESEQGVEEVDEPNEPDEPVTDSKETQGDEDRMNDDKDNSALPFEEDKSPEGGDMGSSSDSADEHTTDKKEITAVGKEVGVVVPGKDSALYLPSLTSDSIRDICIEYDEDKHSAILGEFVKVGSAVPCEIFLTDQKDYALVLYDRMHGRFFISYKLTEKTIRYILEHGQITKVCWQPYFLYSHCKSLGVEIRTVHSLFTSNAIFNPALPYIPRANTLKAYIDVWRSTKRFRLKKTGVALFDEMQCYYPAYRMQLNTLGGTKALSANYLRDEVLGRSFMRRTAFNDNGCLFDIDRAKGQLHYNEHTNISCKTSGVILTYILEEDNLETSSVFHLYMRALIMLAGKGFFRKFPIQLMLMDSQNGIMQLFVGNICYDLIKTNLQVYFNTYAIEHSATRFRLYVDAQVQNSAGSPRKLPSYSLLPISIDDALDIYSTSDAVVRVSESHIIKPMLARKATGNNEKIASFPPKIDE